MEYRQLGKSGARVSAIGLGTNQFGGKVDQAGVNEIIAAALDAGVNFIDTSDSYQGGRSEETLGAALKGRLSFFVDEDPAKQGATFAECPIISVPEIPEESVVVVAFNNPEASRSMCERLKQVRPEINFVAPPMA